MQNMWSSFDTQMMQRALALARRGQGYVEPNPMVGCAITSGEQVIGEGWHERFGGPHAEIEALRLVGSRAAGATMYVTLEPCCHHGKTPPCTEAIIAAGIKRVVAAMSDPFPQVAGGGLARLTAAGIVTEVGLEEPAARELNAPYHKLLASGRPWVIAKWAMTMDGKIATAAGHSRWISNESSRRIVHQLRGRVDAIVIGRKTAELDDPLLTARLDDSQPPRVAARIVFDSMARTRLDSQLVRTARQTPTLIATGPDALDGEVQRLTAAGCEVVRLRESEPVARVSELLDELGRRRMTNILVEGGSELLGSFFDAGQIDEAHVFIAPKLFGGSSARSPIGGSGVAEVANALRMATPQCQEVDGDVCVHGRLQRAAE
jgi:diaminohydroxyphosphoribosylaminopyrimidine deaminase/5-amino-6-(5-phosphoribosylamino)uracil reductase